MIVKPRDQVSCIISQARTKSCHYARTWSRPSRAPSEHFGHTSPKGLQGTYALAGRSRGLGRGESAMAARGLDSTTAALSIATIIDRMPILRIAEHSKDVGT